MNSQVSFAGRTLARCRCSRRSNTLAASLLAARMRPSALSSPGAFARNLMDGNSCTGHLRSHTCTHAASQVQPPTQVGRLQGLLQSAALLPQQSSACTLARTVLQEAPSWLQRRWPHALRARPSSSCSLGSPLRHRRRSAAQQAGHQVSLCLRQPPSIAAHCCCS